MNLVMSRSGQEGLSACSVQGFAVCVKHGLTKVQLDETVGLHPTAAEEFVLMSSPARRYRDGKLWLKQD